MLLENSEMANSEKIEIKNEDEAVEFLESISLDPDYSKFFNFEFLSIKNYKNEFLYREVADEPDKYKKKVFILTNSSNNFLIFFFNFKVSDTLIYQPKKFVS